jgi:hypothetical protein
LIPFTAYAIATPSKRAALIAAADRDLHCQLAVFSS